MVAEETVGSKWSAEVGAHFEHLDGTTGRAPIEELSNVEVEERPIALRVDQPPRQDPRNCNALPLLSAATTVATAMSRTRPERAPMSGSNGLAAASLRIGDWTHLATGEPVKWYDG